MKILLILMKSLRVEHFRLDPSPELAKLCHYSNNLYNEATYLVRQWFFKHGEWLRYNTLNWLLKDVRQSENYKDFLSQSAQSILRLVDKNWKSFFESIKDWKKHPEKYKGRPNLPGYRKKNGEFLVLFNNQQIWFQKRKGMSTTGMISLGKQMPKIKTRLPKETNLKGARLLPQHTGYLLEIIYEFEMPEIKKKPKRIATIDIGQDNLVAMVNNFGAQPIVIKGKIVKALNQWFNKQRAMLQGVYDRQNVKNGTKQIILSNKRKRELQAFFHKATRKVMRWCTKHNVDTLVIGYNPGWKQDINLGKRTNQNFVNIPFLMLVEQLEYKGKEAQIQVIRETEEYTSKCSFLDLETIGKHKKYKGKRIYRGLFRSKKGILINADLNAAYNIMRKVFPEIFSQEDVDRIVGEATGLHPKQLLVR